MEQHAARGVHTASLERLIGAEGRAGRRRQRGLKPSGIPWILPAFAFVVGIIYYCIGYTGYMSTLTWDGTSPNPPFVGLANYVRAFHDPIFWGAVGHTVVFLGVTFVVQTTIGFVAAVLLHSKIQLRTLYKVILFIPVILPPAIMAPVFREIFAYDGQFNWVLSHIGLGFLVQGWLAQSSTALPVLMAITVWEWTGLTFILYFSAISQIDQEILEAARLDGAGNIRTLVSIIWPSVGGTTAAILVLSVIGALKTFDVPYLVTLGGPNFATEFLGTLIYRESIPLAEVGYSSAVSILLLMVALAASIFLTVRAARRAIG